jgi:hypothetical protein
MKTNGGVDVYIFVSLTSALVGGQRSALLPGKELPISLSSRLGEPHDVERRKYLASRGLKLQLLGHPACNQSL